MNARSLPSRALPKPRTCPVCRWEAARRLFTQQFEWIREGALLSGYDVVVCDRCGCGYADGIPEQEAFDAYYRDLSKYERLPGADNEAPEDPERFGKVAEVILGALPSRAARIVEIGCATGGLLARLQEAGCTRLTGLDPSPECARSVRERYGIEALTGSIADLPRTGRRFDFAILLGVLEHLRDVDVCLSHIREVLDPDGRILVDVPDVTRFPDFADAPFQEFSIEHINFLSPVSLRNLLAGNGFEILGSGQDVHPHGDESHMPNAYCVGRRGSERPGLTFERDTETEPALLRYIARSVELERELARTIDAIADAGEPILVWGVGTLARRLLKTSRLKDADIRAFVDSNPRYHGKDINGIPILPPGDVRGRPEAILICSRVFSREIETQIRETLHCSNRLLRLGGPPKELQKELWDPPSTGRRA